MLCLITCFRYCGGELQELHVLMLIYTIMVHLGGYKKNSHPQPVIATTCWRSTTPGADYLFCLCICIIITDASYLLVGHYKNLLKYVLLLV